MRTRNLALTVIVVGLITCGASFAVDPDWRTAPPVTYVLDYGQGHIGNPEYIETVAKSPPTILHLGKDVVMSHNWGPIQGVGGENQAGGKGEAIRRLSPEETWERYHALEEMVDSLHAAGVQYVMPYICSVTIGGHHEHRRGFWEFYDHWDEYRDFGLPPRPELDPADWMQRLPDGSMKPTYGCKPDEDEFYPPYEPNIRYAACVNNPGWQAWIRSVARLVAAVGYDGAFIDNGSNQRCYCRFCQAKYQDYLRGKYTDEQMEELFGAGPDEEVPLAVKPGRDEPVTLGWVESRRFWRESIHEHHQAMKRAAEEVTDRFILFPNGCHNRPETVKTAFRASDYAMYELSMGDYGTHPGLVRSRIVGDLHMKVRNHHIWQLKYTQAVRENVSALLLTRGGYPSTKRNLVLNEQAAALGNAEAAAFGSGAGFLLRPRWDQYEDVLNRYGRFFEEHEDLYAGMVPYAQVGVTAFGEQSFYEHKKHINSVETITDELSARQVLFDYLTEEQFTAEHLADFDAVIFANVKYATREQIDALDSYVRAGGTVMVIGGTPTHDMLMREFDPQQSPPALRPAEGDADLHRNIPYGEGRWLRYSRLPLEDLVDLISPRAGLSVAPEAGPGVRCNAFIDPDDRTTLMVHVLNYDTPLGVDPQPLEPKRDLSLRVRLPEGATVEAVQAFEPGGAVQQIAHQTADGHLLITLPELRIYTVLRVELG